MVGASGVISGQRRSEPVVGGPVLGHKMEYYRRSLGRQGSSNAAYIIMQIRCSKISGRLLADTTLFFAHLKPSDNQTCIQLNITNFVVTNKYISLT